MPKETPVDDRDVRDAVQMIIDRLIEYDVESRIRVFRTAETFFGLESTTQDRFTQKTIGSNVPSSPTARDLSFSDRQELPPKEFLMQKQPKTDVERVACLAYYLAHFRDTPHFKTVDISRLNTEAAHVKFSNTAYAVANAANSGLLVSAGKGAKQISAMGERYVEELPDHNSAAEVKASMRSKRTRKKNNSK